MKEYLGDSVYADFDGYHLVLTTENGYGPSNTIGLEPPVYAALLRYQEGVADALLRAKTLEFDGLCSDCPPLGYPNNKTRCTGCPRWARSLDVPVP